MNYKSVFLFFWIWSVVCLAGVGHGNPSSFYNPKYNYKFQFSADEFSLKKTSDELIELTSILNTNSYVKFLTTPTTILNLEDLSRSLNLSSCSAGQQGNLQGYKCQNRLILLVPGVQYFEIEYSDDDDSRKVLSSFQYLVLDRQRMWSQGVFQFESDPTANIEMLGLIDHDSKVVLVSKYRISVRNVNDLSLVLEIPFNNNLQKCALHAESQQIACVDGMGVRVWNLRDGKNTWSFNGNQTKNYIREIIFLDANSLLYLNSKGTAGTVYEIKIGSSETFKKLDSVESLFGAWDLGGVQYINIQQNQLNVLVDYKSLKTIQSFNHKTVVVPVPQDNRILTLSASSASGVNEISKIDIVTKKQDWTVYYSSDNAYSNLKLGNNYFAVRDIFGNIFLYNLITGEKRPEFFQTIVYGYSGIVANNAYNFFIGEDGKTFYRMGPRDLSIGRLEQGTLVKKIITDSSFSIIQKNNSQHVLLKKNNDSSLVLWDINKTQAIQKIPMSDLMSSNASITQDSKHLYTSDSDAIYDFDLVSGKLISKMQVKHATIIARPNGGAIVSSNNYLYMVNFELKSLSKLPLTGTKFLVDETDRFLFVYNQSEYLVYDLQSEVILYRSYITKEGGQNGNLCSIGSIVLRSQNQFLISSSCGTFLKEISTNSVIKKLDHFYDGYLLSPSGKHYVFRDFDINRLIVFETSTNRKINEIWGHADPKCSYSPIGTSLKYCGGVKDFIFLSDDMLLTSGDDQSIRYWRVR